jgi:hypothetical protein
MGISLNMALMAANLHEVFWRKTIFGDSKDVQESISTGYFWTLKNRKR